MRRRRGTPPPSPEFRPVRMETVEIGEPLGGLAAPGATRAGLPFAASLCLVLLHDHPLGMVEVELGPAGVEAGALAATIQRQLGAAIAEHLAQDGIAAAPLTAAGLPSAGLPPCLEPRQRLLADAPRLSVIISTRNRPDSVRLTLRSILECRYPSDRWEVIVVDNAGEADPSIAEAAATVDTEVPVRVLHEPLPGLSNARNCGLAAASGEIVVYADDDVEVNRDWLLVLALPFQRDARVGATSGMTLPGALETPTQRWTEGFGGREGPLRTRRFDLAEPPPDRPLFPFTVGEFGAGRNMAFRRELLQRLGGFDPALGPGTIAHDGDDIEALLRVVLAGEAIFHDPAAIVWHAHPEDYEELESRVLGYGAGLSACLTKAVLDRPSLALDLVRKLPAGVAFAVSSDSQKNVGRPADFPRSLATRELLGLIYGPVAYLRSRRQARRRRRAQPPQGGGENGEPARLRILVVSDEYKPVIGGAARSAELLSHHVSSLGHTVAVATAWQPDTPAREMDGPVAVHRVQDLSSRAPWLSEDPQRHHAPPFPDPEATWKLRKLIDEFEPDVVHAYGWLAHTAAAALAGRRVPLLLSARDYGNVCTNFTLVRNGKLCSGPAPLKCLSCSASTYGAPKGAVAAASVFAAKPLLRRKLTAIHGVSGFVSEFVGAELDPPRAFTRTIPNFHEERPGVADPELLDQLPDRPFILFVGHLRRYKGIFDLLAAYSELEGPPPLVLVGTKGPDTPETFPPGVTVLTYVPHPTVMAMWERALFGVFPSIAPEALGNVVHEAMSKRRAMIGTRPGGHEDMIDHEETGLLIDNGDVAALRLAMARLIEDETLRERLGAAAEQRARDFTPGRILPQIERLYYDTIAHFEREEAR